MRGQGAARSRKGTGTQLDDLIAPKAFRRMGSDAQKVVTELLCWVTSMEKKCAAKQKKDGEVPKFKAEKRRAKRELKEEAKRAKKAEDASANEEVKDAKAKGAGDNEAAEDDSFTSGSSSSSSEDAGVVSVLGGA